MLMAALVLALLCGCGDEARKRLLKEDFVEVDHQGCQYLIYRYNPPILVHKGNCTNHPAPRAAAQYGCFYGEIGPVNPVCIEPLPITLEGQ